MNRDYALIDANLARAREGLRVLDDAARFILHDQILFEKIKQIRHSLTPLEERLGDIKIVASRAAHDVGEDSPNPEGSSRSSLYSIIRANSRRVAEALRLLEEFALLYFPKDAQNLKMHRYNIYKLELELLKATPQYHLRRYFQKGIIYPLSSEVSELMWLIDHGARVVQLRDKKSTEEQIRTKVKELCAYLQKYKPNQVLLIINDYPEIAASFPVAGVHIGQEDGDVTVVRRIIGSNKIIGCSTHSVAQAERAAKSGADYLSIGPVFATPTKAEREPVGLDAVRAVANTISIPWLAIGGIDKETYHDVQSAGARTMAVVRSGRTFFGG